MDFEEAVRLAGYPNLDEYARRFVAPVLASAAILFSVSVIIISIYGRAYDLGAVQPLLILAPVMVILLAVIGIFIYPFYVIERIKVNIHENIHYFITYAGALSTLPAGRRWILAGDHVNRRPRERRKGRRRPCVSHLHTGPRKEVPVPLGTLAHDRRSRQHVPVRCFELVEECMMTMDLEPLLAALAEEDRVGVGESDKNQRIGHRDVAGGAGGPE